MKIQSLQIDNFRGIKHLAWTLPLDQKLITLVGPGDSGKSTVLEAIHDLLGDRWAVPFADTDFFQTDVSTPISIRAVLVEAPPPLLTESTFGLWQSGLDDEGELHHDPEDAFTPCLIVRLSVDESLEPKWTVERTDGETQYLTATQRRSFSTFKVDDRTDAQLRWSRTSALGRMSMASGGEREALTAASRAARQALSDHDGSALAGVASQVQDRANSIGGGRFEDLRPGLDTSRSSMGANLALYEGTIPLTSYGLGSRRLASLAVQQIAAGTRAVAVVDELESGLEPHRAVRLLQYLTANSDYSQVIVTTHAPTVVEQAQLESLAVVHNHSGEATIRSLAASDDLLQRVRRSRPSSFLARRVVIGEGKTEHGVLLECVEHWDAERTAVGLSTSAGEGVAIQDGQGGTEVAPRAAAMATLGFGVIGLLDNDDRSVDRHVAAAEREGSQFVRWEKGLNIEGQVCSALSERGLTSLLQVASEVRHGDATVIADLNSVVGTPSVDGLDVSDWCSAGMTVAEARGLVAQAAVDRSWFKQVDSGRAIGRWLITKWDKPSLAQTISRLEQIKSFIYPSEVITGGQDEPNGPKTN